MSKEKKDLPKKVLNVLQEQLQPLTTEEGATLTGGFASTSADSVIPDIEGNVPCNTKNGTCPTNTVAGCSG